MIRRVFLATLIIIVSSSGYAQRGSNPYTTKNKKAIAAYQQSENYLVRRQYAEVVGLMQQALNKDENFVEARLRLATALKLLGQSERALIELEKAAQAKSSPSEVQFSLAEGYWQAGRYNDAKLAIELYLENAPRSRPMQEAAQHILKSVGFAQAQIEKPSDFNPEKLPPPLNQMPLQYFPVLTADGSTLVYTLREGASAANDEDIVASKWDGANWSRPISISDSINSSANEGTCTISADGRTIIFTSCQGRRTYGSCDLYISYKTGDDWSTPRNLGSAINSRYWESQPSLTADGRTLYFVSDRPGGRGQTDIYIAYKKDDGSWQEPINAGPTINTRGDEVSPFIHANGKSLYFSSNGHTGMGGYDIFLTEQQNSIWSTPKNLGYPINTHQDQVSLFVSADGGQGYYSVEDLREGRLNTSELYSFQMPASARVSTGTTYINGRVFNAKNKKPLAAKVQLISLGSDSLINSVSSDAVSGTYLMVLPAGSQYGLYVEKAGYLYKSLKFNVEAKSGKSKILDIYLHPIEIGAITELSNVFFETDQYALNPKSQTELKKLVTFLKDNPTIKIEVGGHTDNVGETDYNQKLSENRAKAVKEHLKSKGIDAQRIQSVGYGMSNPKLPNTTPEGKQANRRIEIKLK